MTSTQASKLATAPRTVDTQLILTLAALLIFNSHLEAFYPRSWMAADGLLGNSIFFLISGFGVQSSLCKRRQTFVPYFINRLVRIYPVVLMATLLLYLPFESATQRPTTMMQWLGLLIWPTRFTYVEMIIPLYVLLYIIGHRGNRKIIGVAWMIAVSTFMASAIWKGWTMPSHHRLQLGSVGNWIYFAYDLTLVLTGALLAANDTLLARLRSMTLAPILFILLGAYVATKFGMVVSGVGARGFVILFVLVFLAGVASLLVLSQPHLLEWLRRNRATGAVIALISSLTLEIYVVHQPLSEFFPSLQKIVFPLNIFVLFAITLAVSFAFSKAAKLIQRQ